MLAVVCGVAPAAHAGSLFAELAATAPELDREVLRLALDAVACARADRTSDSTVLTVIDYSLPSTVPRLWVFDLDQRELRFRELVAHGKNTGENHATEFSNRHGSKQSSLGLFKTAGTYHGRNGYSLKLHGLEEGVNHNALDRTIVLHGAWYVTEDFARQHGRLGRSWGCPAVRTEVAEPLIDAIKGGSFLFVYYPDEKWLDTSGYLRQCRVGTPRNPRRPETVRPKRGDGLTSHR
jgi:hypothetical protein